MTDMLIRLAGIVPESYVDGPGIRFTIFVQGCPHGCVGCHNPETHDFSGGRVADTDKILKKTEQFPLSKGITFSGGEPFCQPEPLACLVRELKKRGHHVMSYTGYTFEQLLKMSGENEHIKALMSCLDLLVDGRFVLSEKTLELPFRGSRNQRIIDMPKSMEKGEAIIFEL